jgi:hypothetical protein
MKDSRLNHELASNSYQSSATFNVAVSPFNATTPAITLEKYVRHRYFTIAGWPQNKNRSRYDH